MNCYHFTHCAWKILQRENEPDCFFTYYAHLNIQTQAAILFLILFNIATTVTTLYPPII